MMKITFLLNVLTILTVLCSEIERMCLLDCMAWISAIISLELCHYHIGMGFEMHNIFSLMSTLLLVSIHKC
jgi:hypothetical protein